LYTINTTMSLFSGREKRVRYGVLIEIGSGSVLLSIIKSDATKINPEVIWSQREFASLKSKQTSNQDDKAIMSSLLNVILQINNNGYKALRSYSSTAQIKYVQVSVTAPWSFTISKTIDYTKETEFVVSQELIDSLISVAKKKMTEIMLEKELTNKYDFSLLTEVITDFRLNDYQTNQPLKQKVKSLSLTQIVALASTFITETVTDLQRKVLPRAEIVQYSFMMIFYSFIKNFYSRLSCYCLIDITYEATEIVIVRNSAFQTTNHTTIGINTIARNIANALNIPHEEAISFLREPYHSTALKALPKNKLELLQKVFVNYQTELRELFTENNANFSIPRDIFFHCSMADNAFLLELISEVAKTVTNLSHQVTEISEAIITKYYSPTEKKKLTENNIDTGVLLEAQFFHQHES